MPNNLDVLATKRLVTMVTFSWGSSNVARYCRYTDDISDSGQTFTSAPEQQVDPDRISADSRDNPWSLMMNTSRPPFDKVFGYAHGRLKVVFEEMDPSDSTTRRKIFAGYVLSVLRNPSGNSGLTKAVVNGWKQLLTVPLGMNIGNKCPWTFGDGNCTFNATGVTEMATVASVAGTVVTLTGLTTTGTTDYWRLGYLARDGLNIMVRAYTTGSSMTLELPPPPDWTGQTVACIPGCDKTINACRTKWSNEQNFCGAGIAIPLYNPMVENPAAI